MSTAARALGVAVFFGMIGVTVFGLICTPVFYVACRKIAVRLPKRAAVTPWRSRTAAQS